MWRDETGTLKGAFGEIAERRETKQRENLLRGIFLKKKKTNSVVF